jgi:hemoglobin
VIYKAAGIVDGKCWFTVKILLKLSSLAKRLLRSKATSGSDTYSRMGGLEVIDKVVNDFYEIMSTDPVAEDCLATHSGRDIRISAEKLKYFLSGWTGGPPLYMNKYGHPRLRMRHFPFSIGAKESDQWLYCMRKALARSTIDPGIQEELMNAFTHLTKLIQNKEITENRD